jgi:hypothetical protein
LKASYDMRHAPVVDSLAGRSPHQLALGADRA